jgi:hypothetical protein
MSLQNSEFFFNSAGGFYPYEIDGSLRFNKDDSAYLTRTPASSGNQKTWTLSAWIKKCFVGQSGGIGTSIFGAGSLGNNPNLRIYLSDSGIGTQNPVFYIQETVHNVSNQMLFYSNAFLRDASSWYHLVISVDTTQATASNRLKVYLNNQLLTGTTHTQVSQNQDLSWNRATPHYVGASTLNNSTLHYFDGYLAEIHNIDGQALDPSSFAETKSGVWVPKEYAGTYGTNGFYLKFAGNVNDSSGNGNNWTANNITANDYMADSPTNNWCVLNPATPPSQLSLSEGNLKADAITGASNWGTSFSTFNLPSSGKYYIECLAQVQTGVGNRGGIGVIDSSLFLPSNTNYVWDETTGEGFDGIDMQMFDNIFYSISDGVSTSRATGLTATAYVLMLAVDIDNGKVFTGYNGTWVNSGNPAAGTGQTADRTFTTTDVIAVHTAWAGTNNQRGIANFGQDSTFAGYTTAGGNSDANGIGDFKYSVPSGFLALCTANLPEPAISPADDKSPSDYFNTVLYTGNGGTQSITGVGFQPDWVWGKNRGTTNTNHGVFDVIRGVTKRLAPDTVTQQTTEVNSLTAFNADGFSVGNTQDFNQTGIGHVAWNWKAGGTGVSNTAGSITSTVSANQDAGFSIVGYTGNGASTATVGHGLTVAPSMVIIKNRDSGAAFWPVYHEAIPSSYVSLNSTTGGQSGQWMSVDTDTINFSSFSSWTNTNTNTYIAYCFAEIEGYSKFGSYTGNNNADGPFVYTGFRPAFVITKASGTTGNWAIFDSTRDAFNDNDLDMFYVNSSLAESAFAVSPVDLLSNGFKIRHTTGNGYANAAATHIYMAFAENPFKYANAR